MIEYENLGKLNKSFFDRYKKSFEQVLDSGWYILGNQVAEFEKEFKLNDHENLFPLYLITDNGRGKSNKKFRISPDYKSSKYKSYMKYELSVIEDNTIIERKKFLLDPDYIENNENKSLEHVCKQSYQIRAKLFEDNFILFLTMNK